MQQRWILIALSLLSCFSAAAQSWQIEGLQIKHQKNKQAQGKQEKDDDKQNRAQTQLILDKVVVAGEIFENINYQCPEVVQIYPRHWCQNAQLNVDWQGQHWDMQLDSVFNFNDVSGSLNAKLFNQQLSVNYPISQSAIDIELNKLQLKSLSAWLPDIINESLMSEFSGLATFDLDAMTVSAKELAYSGFEGGYGNDMLVSQLAGSIEMDIALTEPSFQWTVDIVQGEALFGPVYVNFAEFPLQLSGDMRLDGVDGWLLNLKIKQSNSMQIILKAKLGEQGEVSDAELKLEVLDSVSVNKHLLSAVFDLYGFKQSEMEGEFQVEINYDGSQLTSGSIAFNDFYYNNNLRKLSASALNGTVAWHRSEKEASYLNWESLLLAGMPVGSASASFEFYADEFLMLGQPEWPVFDGIIVVQNWHMSQLFSEFVDMEIAAEIMPISLSMVTEKMGWPLMKGSMSGKIPAVIKKGPVISLAGGLDLKVFEGRMRINQMSTERLFGVAPVIAGDVSFEELNLGQLTETFDFGRITGLVSGKVDDLRITNWKTDRLKAEIHTVKKKGVKQTISQQAIDHISSLGGIQGALSRTFLRFFDDFKYKNIKLSCVLHNAVCHIGGIKNSAKQFIIVEGGGIPKINIVGFVRKVDWDTFISRLLNANYDG